jgi:hypothetical protein
MAKIAAGSNCSASHFLLAGDILVVFELAVRLCFELVPQ